MLVTLSVADFLDPENDETKPLLAEYAEECRLAGLPVPVPHRAIYEQLDNAGVFTLIGYRYEGKLIGFVGLLVSMNPHYSQLLGTTESLFVASAYRKTGAGLALLREAEREARGKGAVGLLVSAPFGEQLAEVLRRKQGYTSTNEVFLKVFR